VSNLFLTLVIAFVVIVFAIALLAIGWLMTGKTKIQKGCGQDPTQKSEGSCSTCEVCGPFDPSPSRPSETNGEKKHLSPPARKDDPDVP